MAVICRGVAYIYNMTETSPILENVARLSKLPVTNNIFSSNLLWKLFLNFRASSNFSLKVSFWYWWLFLNCYLAVPRLTLGHYLGDSFTLLMLIITFLQFWLECQGSLEWSCAPVPGWAPLGFELVTYWF